MKTTHCSKTDKSADAEVAATNKMVRRWIMRMIVPLGGYREFVYSYGFGDEALAIHLGLSHSQERPEIATLVTLLRKMHQQVERSRSKAAVPVLLNKNVERLGEMLWLDSAGKAILAFTVLLQSDPWLQRAARQLGCISQSRLIDILTELLRIDRACIRYAMAPSSPLHESGLLSAAWEGGDRLDNRLRLLSPGLADKMMYVDERPIELLSDTIARSQPATLNLQDFAHLPMRQLLVTYLRESQEQKRLGVNVLIYGEPGAGKTELARVVSNQLRCEMFEVAAQDAVGHCIDAQSRLRAYSAAQGMLRQHRAMLLFDEIEDVFAEGSAGQSGTSLAQSRKAWMNRTLENNPVPTFWITNSVKCLDPAFVRRFDIVLEAKLPSGSARQGLVERACGEFIEPAARAQLLHATRLAPAVLERAASVIRMVRHELQPAQASQAMMQLVDSTLSAQGHGPMIRSGLSEGLSAYDPAFVSAVVELDRIAEGLAKSRSGRLCLYGPPGTGKTAYGRWLAQQLDRPLHAKIVSDIVAPYLGQTEQNLARCFRQAADEGAVLMIDEVDGFLRDRRHAQRGWEVTAVNEMLVQMEGFEGLFIASTNLMNDLDPAALRRFDLKVKFDYLKADQAWRLLQTSCTTLGLEAPTNRERDRLASMQTLTPGDFAAVARQHRFRLFGDAAALTAALAAECALKQTSSSRSIGFMATAI